MIFVTGPLFAGKQEWICRQLAWTEADFAEKAVRDVQELAVRPGCPFGLTEKPAITMPANADLRVLAEELAKKEVVVATEVGGGVVPLDAGERLWRERAGRLACLLAERAESVIRVTCGLPQLLKGPMPRKHRRALLIRHGITTLQEEHRYQGRSDAPLSERGRALLRTAGPWGQNPDGSRGVVYVTSRLRTRQTAEILFPGTPQVEIPGLSEMNFGAFEDRSAAEMEQDAAYRAWVESGCTSRCPGGEDLEEFSGRVGRAFAGLMDELEASGGGLSRIVAHGGTQMAVLGQFAVEEGSYFSWQLPPGEGYLLNADEWEETRRVRIEKILSFHEDPDAREKQTDTTEHFPDAGREKTS